MKEFQVLAENMGTNLIQLHQEIARLTVELEIAYQLLTDKEARIEELEAKESVKDDENIS